jgi:hypothetical protein
MDTVVCRCGTLRGTLRPGRPGDTLHLVCYCRDCQTFAHALGQPERVLDAHGGTELLQVGPARLTLEAGADRLACLRLRPKGLLRWYAACCATPIGNTLATPDAPFVGLITACLDDAARAALPPPRRGVFGRTAHGGTGDVPAASGPPLGLGLKMAAKIMGRRLRGEHRPTPFFDAHNRPVAEPRVLGEAERAACERRAMARR